MGMNNEQGVRIVMDSYALFLFFDCLPLGLRQVSQRRTLLVVLDDVIIEDVAVVASHLQCRVSHDLLKGERITAAVHQILPSEGVPERMDRSPLNTSVGVVLYDSEPQSILSQEAAELITEQVVGRFTLPNCHVISQDGHHRSAKGNDLNLSVFRVPENNLLSAQVYILILNVPNSGSPTTAVQKEVYDDPIPILAELAIGFRLLQECEKFLVCVSFLHSF